MPEPPFRFRQSSTRLNHYTGTKPDIDEERATAVLVRQSKTGADTAQAESRETQLELQSYARTLYVRKVPNVRLYDEGAGVSGQKRIDERKHLDRLYQDMHKGIISTIVLAREDRLFRNKHMDQVGTFTKLAEEMKIIVIVPPVSANTDRAKIYDFSIYRDLLAFQDKMREAYAYIEGHVKYMQLCKRNKAEKGGYDGRPLPPGLVVIGKKQNQEIVVYEPWAVEMRKLANRAQALSWDVKRLNREVADMPRLFPEIPEEDQQRYMFKTRLTHFPGVGYKPLDAETIKSWMTNEMLIGWFQPTRSEPDVIVDNHPAVLDYALFAEGYAELKGYTLEGEPYPTSKSVKRIRKTREDLPDLIFHGRLVLVPPSSDRTAYISVDQLGSRWYYHGRSRQAKGMITDKLLSLPGASFDEIVVNRLKALENADVHMKDKVKATLEQVHDQQSEDFVSIHEQLDGIKAQLLENAKKRMKTSADDPMYILLQEESSELLERQHQLELKKDKLGLLDSPEEITRLHTLLGNFEAVWPTFDILERQRAFSLLINRIEIEVISPHWLRLSIDWLDAISPRVDIAYLWKGMPGQPVKFSDEEKSILAGHYPSLPRIEVLKLLPNRTWNAITNQACELKITRTFVSRGDLPIRMCYYDLAPNGKYLFGDYQTTLQYIKQADDNTSASEFPLYPIWIFAENSGDMVSLVKGYLEGKDSEIPRPIEEASPIACSR